MIDLKEHGFGGGGASGISNIYRLFTQSTEPTMPKQGDIWVIPNKTVSKVTISLNVPSTPIDGELLLQFEHIVYGMDFQKISSKIGGNLNSNTYVFNINNLAQEVITGNFIALFKKDVVTEYGILKNIKQYNSATSLWEVPISKYYNGTNWVDMTYRIQIQYSDWSIEKRLVETMSISETLTNLPANVYIFQKNNDGSYYGKAMSGTNIVVTKYKADGTLISTNTITVDGGLYPHNIFFVDDFGNMYVHYGASTTTLSIANHGRYLKKISSSGTVIYTVDLGLFGTDEIQFSYFCGSGYGYAIFRMYGVQTASTGLVILNLNTGTFSKVIGLGGYQQAQSNVIFEEDGFYIFNDDSTTANTGFSISKYNYSGTKLKYASIYSSTYVPGLTSGNPGYIRISKDNALADTFIIFYNAGYNSIASYNKVTCDFTAHTVTSIFKITISVPAGTGSSSSGVTVPRIDFDYDNNCYIAWVKNLYKYKPDGTNVYTQTGTKTFSAYTSNNYTDGFIKYIKG